MADLLELTGHYGNLPPMLIMLLMDPSVSYRAFAASEVTRELTELERRELASLLVHKIVGPADTHPITHLGAAAEASANTDNRTEERKPPCVP